jgi:hypothetical protein
VNGCAIRPDREISMTGRLVLKPAPRRPELERLLEQAKKTVMTDEERFEQIVSFVYGNAPANSGTTKESARAAVNRYFMRPASK